MFTLLALVALTASVGTQATPLTPTTIDRKISKIGASRFVGETYDRTTDWDFVMNHISSGEAAWIGVAQAMKPGTDGSSAEQLDQSLALALVHAPANVLQVLVDRDGDRWSVNVICKAPLPTPGKSELVRYKAAAIKAVKLAHDPKLQARKVDCLNTLRSIDTSKSADFYQ